VADLGDPAVLDRDVGAARGRPGSVDESPAGDEQVDHVAGPVRSRNVACTSTGLPVGSAATPSATRACRPAPSPNTSVNNSVAASATRCWSVKPGADATHTDTDSTRSTAARPPSPDGPDSSSRTAVRTLRAHCRAQDRATSSDTSSP